MAVELKLDNNLKKFTWDEVKKHNNRQDCWVVLEREVKGVKKGLVLDITNWAAKHPGGSVIYDGAGGDCTIAFWSYHPLSFIDNSNSYMNKFVIGEVQDYKNIYNISSKFFRTLKERVEAKIPRSNRRGGWAMYLKSVFILSMVALTYKFGWMTGNLPIIALFGFAVAHIAINMMHDGVHYAYSANPMVSRLAAYAMNLAGANYMAYQRSHVFGHHAYTNHDELDSAILRPFPSLKLHTKLKGKWFHAVQHLYMLGVYGLGALQFWVGDFKEVASLYNYPKRDGPLTTGQKVALAFGKLFFLYWCFYLPMQWFPASQAALHILIFMSIMGGTVVTAFAVNHWTDKAVLVTNKDLIATTQDWAGIQVLSSCNFAPESFFWTCVCGGVNLQIEHHLFPAIVHTQLLEIAPIVRKTCIEYGLPYDKQCFPTFTDAILSNISFIKRVGTQTHTQPSVMDLIEGKHKHA